MIKEGSKAKIKPEHLVSSLKRKDRTIYFNSQLIGTLFQISYKIKQIIWYHFGIKGS